MPIIPIQSDKKQKKLGNVFIGISIPIDITSIIKEMTNYKIDFLEWIEPLNFHLTVRFLGQIEEQEILLIKTILPEIEFKSFVIKLKHISFWEPNFLVIESTISKDLLEIKEKIDKKISGILSIPLESREFKPHITIAKVKKKRFNKELLANYLNMHTDSCLPEFTVKFFCLYQTVFNENCQLRYEKLISIEL